MRFSWRGGVLWTIGLFTILGAMVFTWVFRTCGYSDAKLTLILVSIYLWPILLPIAALFFTVGGFVNLKVSHIGALLSMALVLVVLIAFLYHPEHVSCSVP